MQSKRDGTLSQSTSSEQEHVIENQIESQTSAIPKNERRKLKRSELSSNPTAIRYYPPEGHTTHERKLKEPPHSKSNIVKHMEACIKANDKAWEELLDQKRFLANAISSISSDSIYFKNISKSIETVEQIIAENVFPTLRQTALLGESKKSGLRTSIAQQKKEAFDETNSIIQKKLNDAKAILKQILETLPLAKAHYKRHEQILKRFDLLQLKLNECQQRWQFQIDRLEQIVPSIIDASKNSSLMKCKNNYKSCLIVATHTKFEQLETSRHLVEESLQASDPNAILQTKKMESLLKQSRHSIKITIDNVEKARKEFVKAFEEIRSSKIKAYSNCCNSSSFNKIAGGLMIACGLIIAICGILSLKIGIGIFLFGAGATLGIIGVRTLSPQDTSSFLSNKNQPKHEEPLKEKTRGANTATIKRKLPRTNEHVTTIAHANNTSQPQPPIILLEEKEAQAETDCHYPSSSAIPIPKPTQLT